MEYRLLPDAYLSFFKRQNLESNNFDAFALIFLLRFCGFYVHWRMLKCKEQQTHEQDDPPKNSRKKRIFCTPDGCPSLSVLLLPPCGKGPVRRTAGGLGAAARDSEPYRPAYVPEPLRQRKTKPLIAKRNTQNGSGLGKFRYVVEAAFDWLFNQRRLRVRYEKRDDIHQAFLICWQRIMKFC
jgi:hypothetical protein